MTYASSCITVRKVVTQNTFWVKFLDINISTLSMTFRWQTPMLGMCLGDTVNFRLFCYDQFEVSQHWHLFLQHLMDWGCTEMKSNTYFLIHFPFLICKRFYLCKDEASVLLLPQKLVTWLNVQQHFDIVVISFI